MVVRAAVRRLLVDMAADAEAQLGILVQHLARLALGGVEVLGNEVLVVQNLRHQLAHRLLAARAGIGLERGADVGAQLFQGVGHGFTLYRVTLFSMVAKIARATWASPP